MNTFSYLFEELPLYAEAGWEAGSVTGKAELSYIREGDWNVESLTLEVTRQSTPDELKISGARFWVESNKRLEAGSWIYQLIEGRLTDEWADKVQEAVREQLEEDRICAADERADMRRDEMMLEDRS